MIGFLVVAALMIGGAMACMLPPLLRREARTASRSARDANLAVYRNQVRELETDVANGTLSPDQFDASKRELERRLLEDVPTHDDAPLAAARRSPRAALSVAILIPAAAGLLYWHLGTPAVLVDPQVSAASSSHGEGHGMSFEQIDALAQKLADRLAQAPGDAEGWAMLARSYNVLGRHAHAAHAYAKAAALIPGDAQLLADYADALAMAQGGRLEGKPLAAIQRALKADARNVKALALAGTAAFNRREYRSAAQYWERAVESAGGQGEFAESLAASLAEANALAGGLPHRTAPAGDAPVPAPAGGRRPTALARVEGRVTLAPELAAQASPADTVFIYARAAQGPRMPLAMLRRQVQDLPLDFVLDDSSAMTPDLKLSNFDRVEVVARIAKAGTAEARPGDLQGAAGPVPLGAAKVRVKIDRALP